MSYRHFCKCERAHPRVCGENLHCHYAPRTLAGSSPRVRGKLGACEFPVAVGGLIPACAGKTITASQLADRAGAHPRVCGENVACQVHFLRDVGSSPRVRGKPRYLCHDQRRDRLIPACAGKTWGSFSAARPSRAHPRVCGENPMSLGCLSLISGSSPRVRGKRRLLLP